VFNINRLLKDKGYLFVEEGTKRQTSSLMKRLRDFSARMIGKLNLAWLAALVLRVFPFLKKAIVTATGIDLTKTVAYSIDMSGIKAYSYGGIRVRPEKAEKSKEQINQDIIQALREVRHPEDANRPLVEWASTREDLYQGPYASLYPEIVLELAHGYGLGNDPQGALFAQALVHSLYPGSHTRGNAVLILAGPDAARLDVEPESIMDAHPIILDLLGIDGEGPSS
jgi:hypothetical protein